MSRTGSKPKINDYNKTKIWRDVQQSRRNYFLVHDFFAQED